VIYRDLYSGSWYHGNVAAESIAISTTSSNQLNRRRRSRLFARTLPLPLSLKRRLSSNHWDIFNFTLCITGHCSTVQCTQHAQRHAAQRRTAYAVQHGAMRHNVAQHDTVSHRQSVHHSTSAVQSVPPAASRSILEMMQARAATSCAWLVVAPGVSAARDTLS
jgi:hypothetical protein